MKRLALALVPALLLALGTAGPALSAPSALPSRFDAPVYLALGDSVAAGVGAVQYRTGYPELTRPQVAAGYNTRANKATPNKTGPLDLVNLSVGGATTTTLLSRQLEPALELIEKRRTDRDPFNDVEIITVTIGGNDVFTPVLAACVLTGAPSRCQAVTDLALGQLGANLTSILSQLTAAAGPRTEVVVTTYYNPIGSCFVTGLNPAAPAIADVVLEGGSFGGFLSLESGVNDVIRASAAAAGAQVADLYGAVGPGQFVGGADCLHPNQAGHARIADVVYATLAQ